MNGSHRSRLLIWAGPLFAVLFLLADLLLEGNAPGEKATGVQVVTYFNAHQGRTLAETFAAPALAALLLLFVSELRGRAIAGGERGAASTAMVAGAVVWAGGMVVGAMVDLALAGTAHHHQVQAAQTFNVLSNDDWIPFIAGVAIFLIGAGGTVLQTRLLPAWLGWVALIGGVLSLAGPGGFVGYFLAPLWIVVAAVVLATRRDTAGTSGPAQRVPAGQHATAVPS